MAKLSSTSVYGNLYVDGEIVNNALDAELGQSIKSLSVNGKTITYTKNNGTTGTITTQDTNTTYGNATTSTSGLMSSADKTKLDGIATNANNYSHPTTSGNKHIPAGGSSGQILRWASDGTATWGNDNNTTYSTGTASTAGLTKLYTGTGTATDGTMTQSAINTALNGKASSSHTHNSITNQDTRNVNTTPTQMPLGLSVHLKSNSTDGLNDGGTYHSTLMIKGWEDVSGGPWAQMTVTANNNLYFRSSNNDTWNAWRKVSLDGHTHNYAGSSSAGGAANSAVKATQDSAGQQINTTYIKGLSVSGKTITYTKGDGTTGTITTQDTNTTYSTGTASTSGLTKLYTGTGTATDGTMTQAAINTALSGKANSSHGTHVPSTCNTITDWNSATTTGWYMASGATNAPTANAWYFGEVIAHNTNYVIQTVYQFTASTDAKAIPKYIRAKMNGTWGSWTNVTVAKAVPSNAVFTDTNTWRGVQDNLTSTATDQSLSANQGRVLKGLIDGKAESSHTHSYLPLSGGTLTGDTTFNKYIKLNAWPNYGTGTANFWYDANNKTVAIENATNLTLGGVSVSKNGHTHNYAGSSSAGGAANSANTLTTARKINGTSFNGSADITTANWGTARTLTIGNTGKSVNGSGNISWSLSEIGAAPISHNHTSLTGVSNIAFAAGSSDSASMGVSVSSDTTYFDFNLTDDTNTDMWRWRFGAWDNSTSSTQTFNAMTLTATSTTAAKLTVPGTIQASTFSGALSGNATTATTLATARTINGTSFNGSANITTANWGTARTITIGATGKSVNGSGNVSWTLDEMGAASRSPFSNTYKQITVGGDANTYYPVLITINRPGIGYPWYNVSISRAYNADAPDTWNTATHKGGLTFQFRWSGDNGWGGNDHNLQVVEFSESYTTMVAGFTLSVSGIVVWLRGGGALYQLNCEQGIGINATVTLGTYTAEDKKTYPVRTNTSSVANEIHKLWVQRGGSVYDNNSRVYSPNNKPTPSAIGAAPALALANSYYGMVTNDGNSSDWIRTTLNGIIPYQSNGGGSSSLGTSGWPFSTVYATNFYGTLNGNATHWGGRQVWWGAAGSRPGNGYIQFVW